MGQPTQEGLDLGAPAGEQQKITIEMPWPPSINHYFQEYAMPPAEAKLREHVQKEGWAGIHKWLRKNTRVMKRVGPKGHDFRNAVVASVLQARLNKGIQGPLKMTIRAYPPDKRKRDLSNLYKVIEDALEQAAVYLDDYQIAAHDSRRELEIVKGGRVVVTLEPLLY